MLTYGCSIWWKRSLLEESKRVLNKLQRLIAIAATGAIRTTPTAALEVIMNWPPLHLYIENQAAVTQYRLKRTGQLIYNALPEGHLSSFLSCVQSMETVEMPQDYISKELIFCPEAQFQVPKREEWAAGNVLSKLEPSVTWFTDGSLINGNAGAGLHCERMNQQVSIPMGTHVTVFQAEMYAIKVATESCKGMKGEKIAICTDSQAAIAALSNHNVTSSLVKESKTAINMLAYENALSVVWVPGHSGIEGNELADELARKGSEMALNGPEPFLPIPMCITKREFAQQLSKNCTQVWENVGGLSHSKACLKGHCGKFTKKLLSMKRNDVRLVCAMLTGHGPFRQHLATIGVQIEGVLCRFCEEEMETGWHVLVVCPAIWRERIEHLGFAVGPTAREGLLRLDPRAVLKFCAAVSLSY